MSKESYKKIPDKLYDLLMNYDLSGSEFRVFLAIYKKTVGFHKKRDFISNSQISKMCGDMPERTIIKSTKTLQLLQIITLVEKGTSSKSPNLWELDVDRVIANGLLQKSALLQKKVKTTAKKGKKLLQKSATTKDIITKDTITKDKFFFDQFLEDFNLIRSHYLPNSRGIKIVDDRCKGQFKTLVKKGVTREDMQHALKTLFADDHHRKNHWKYCTPEFITRGDKFTRFSSMSIEQTQSNSAIGIS